MRTDSNASHVVLAIAGFDPSAGAGLVVDVRTLAAFGCRPVAAITSLTFQNSEAVWGAIHQTAESLRSQILPVVKEFRIAAVKIGMLPTRELVVEVARLIREEILPAPVIDPVLRSTSGFELMEEDAVEALLHELIPLARVITPNLSEVELLTGIRITQETEMHKAAEKLRKLGALAVLVKGGHLSGAQAIDVLDDRGSLTVFRGPRIDSPPVRGTGCMLSAAIAACLGSGLSLENSARLAREYVRDVLTQARDNLNGVS